MIATNDLPRFVRDMLASPPGRGGGLNLWYYRTARLLHAFRCDAEIVALLQAATVGEQVKHGEIERAVERSHETAWQPGQPPTLPRPKWPAVNDEQREAIVGVGGGLVDIWEMSPVRFEDNDPRAEEIIDLLFAGNPMLCVGQGNADFATNHVRNGEASSAKCNSSCRHR